MSKTPTGEQRFRRMLSLAALTDQMVQQNQHPQFVDALLQGLIKRLFGEMIARQIKKTIQSEDTLIFHIPDEAWRGEMFRRKEFILKKAQEIHPAIQKIEVVR